MKLSKKMVSLICLSFIVMSPYSSSTSGIEDNSNLSSMGSLDENLKTVIKSTKEENEDNTKAISEYDENSIDSEIEVNNKEENIILEDNDFENDESIYEKEVVIKAEVVYKRNDITILSNITKEELREVFNSYNGASTMAHLADAFVDAEKEYGVNAFAMAGIVALESGFATSRRAVEDNNLTGYEVYNDASKGRLFDSQYESIMQTARHLAKNYLTEGGPYYNGVSIDAVQTNYCPDKKNNWHNKVDILANGFFKVYKNISTTNQ